MPRFCLGICVLEKARKTEFRNELKGIITVIIYTNDKIGVYTYGRA